MSLFFFIGYTIFHDSRIDLRFWMSQEMHIYYVFNMEHKMLVQKIMLGLK